VRDRSDAARDEAELVVADSLRDLDRPRVVDARTEEDLIDVVEWAETDRSRGEDVDVDSASMVVCQPSVGACEPATTTISKCYRRRISVRVKMANIGHGRSLFEETSVDELARTSWLWLQM